MTEPSIYLLQSQANEESAKIAQKYFPEWAIIMYFYAALHLINDYALELNQIDLLKPIFRTLNCHTTKNGRWGIWD
ncbi:MAG: hypothetical protein HEQ13_20045 [Dolichospermum sp. DEX189]|nr:hypothetical protein AA650_07100 [Anabaena sp. WA102]MBO1071510.1 hypothetical protein [Dolichospermum sp. DEX189]